MSGGPDTRSAWLSIVGIGEDGVDGLGASARRALAAAEVLVGGERHLAMLPEDGRERVTWPRPFDAMVESIAAYEPRPVCVLASGDPMWFGIGSVLAAHFDTDALRVYPTSSSLSLACARLGWAMQDVEVVSAHGRPVAGLVAALQPGARVLVIVNDGATLGAVARILLENGYGESDVTVLEHLGGERERMDSRRASERLGQRCAPLTIIAIECTGSPRARALSRVPGLPDDAFEHDGQLTKRVVRAATLSALQPLDGQCFWDVGAGCGSIAIEWLRSTSRGQAVAIEAKAARAQIIRANAERLGTPALRVVEGCAPAALHGLPAPDAIFIGGGVSDEAVFEHCWAALVPGGRLVGNAVTLEGELALARQHLALGGELVKISVAHSGPTGRFHAVRPAFAVTQLVLTKT